MKSVLYKICLLEKRSENVCLTMYLLVTLLYTHRVSKSLTLELGSSLFKHDNFKDVYRT